MEMTADMRTGLRRSAGLAGSTFVLGVTFGALAHAHGWGLGAPVVASLAIFSGSAQFALLAVLSGGGAAWTAVASAALINLRFFPMALSVAAGVRLVDPVLLRVGRSFQLTLAQTIRKIYLPALLPHIATGLRLGLGVAIIGTLLGEIKMSNRGLGFLIMQDYGRFDIAEMYAVLAVVFVLAALVNGVIARTLRMKGR